MSAPSVLCLLLTADRQEFTDRAVRCFLSQDYENRSLLIYDTGKVPYVAQREAKLCPSIGIVRLLDTVGNIGQLRNQAINILKPRDIIAHWDSDDWSAPDRLTNQVNKLAGANYEVTGYNSMLFWKNNVPDRIIQDERTPYFPRRVSQSEAWLYTGAPTYMLGTSLCYWRETWQRKPFPCRVYGEDTEWQKGLRSIVTDGIDFTETHRPRMIAEIHGGNLHSQINSEDTTSWHRVPEWDMEVRRILESA